MLLYAPSQIALSALHYALSIREEGAGCTHGIIPPFPIRLESCADLMRQFLEKFLGSEEQTEKLMLRLGEIVECVLGDAQPLSSGDNAALQVSILMHTLTHRTQFISCYFGWRRRWHM